MQKKRAFSHRFAKSKTSTLNRQSAFTSVFRGVASKLRRTASTGFVYRQRLLAKQHKVSRVKNVIIRHCIDGEPIRRLLRLPLSRALIHRVPKLELNEQKPILDREIKTEPLSPVDHFQCAQDVSDMFFSIKPEALIKVEDEKSSDHGHEIEHGHFLGLGPQHVLGSCLPPVQNSSSHDTVPSYDHNHTTSAEETLNAILKSDALNMLEKAMLRKEYLNNSDSVGLDLGSIFDSSEENKRARRSRFGATIRSPGSRVKTPARLPSASSSHNTTEGAPSSSHSTTERTPSSARTSHSTTEKTPRSFKQPRKLFRSMMSMAWRRSRQTGNSSGIRGPQLRRSGRERKVNRRYRTPSPQPQHLTRFPKGSIVYERVVGHCNS